eukprot:CAMPEP_0174328676 /NCGR_PEP_ID=MMETSP0810-20121108/15290_1 /TAXON_ID=73025 ORGANISM="Eutreptiella gymnastica-like, Strain CCMP1594" /NCGR_SAMPLE_ID=MMETSP0810 /ASSEMBLY_ACC=CAM_ASM_000659 /LENGTH=161 /DNA_ID=CAMNT_0015442831 /DNA_START=158 /DNA_END=644 /DNA_ORIENTATION=-
MIECEAYHCDPPGKRPLLVMHHTWNTPHPCHILRPGRGPVGPASAGPWLQGRPGVASDQDPAPPGAVCKLPHRPPLLLQPLTLQLQLLLCALFDVRSLGNDDVAEVILPESIKAVSVDASDNDAQAQGGGVAGFMPHTVFDCVFSNQSCRVFAFPNGLKSS